MPAPTVAPRSGDQPRLSLEVLPVGELPSRTAEWIASEVALQFPWLEARVARPFAPRDEWREPGAERFWADRVLDSLVEWHAAEGREPHRDWLLAVTAADLAAPGRSFALGEATVGGCCAVISVARLASDDPDPALRAALPRTRLLKEACHELGHVLGLPHCDRPACVMAPSPGVEHVDRKSADLCPACRRDALRLLRDRS